MIIVIPTTLASSPGIGVYFLVEFLLLVFIILPAAQSPIHLIIIKCYWGPCRGLKIGDTARDKYTLSTLSLPSNGRESCKSNINISKYKIELCPK